MGSAPSCSSQNIRGSTIMGKLQGTLWIFSSSFLLEHHDCSLPVTGSLTHLLSRCRLATSLHLMKKLLWFTLLSSVNGPGAIKPPKIWLCSAVVLSEIAMSLPRGCQLECSGKLCLQIMLEGGGLWLPYLYSFKRSLFIPTQVYVWYVEKLVMELRYKGSAMPSLSNSGRLSC